MNENENLVPKRRFKEFTNTGTWEQRKLEELAESFNYGLNASAMEFDGENKYIRITDIDEQSHKFIQSGLTSPNIDLLNADDYLLKEGDILFARTGASVGKSYQYEPLDGKVYFAGFLIRARIKPEFDPSFIFQNTLTEKYNNFIKVTSQRSGQPGVNAQEYANFSILIPSRGEQVKLGNFFKQLDDTIALHQRKLEKSKALKSAYLSEMFPAEGERKPKRRFAGFTNDWEQRKLMETNTSFTDGNYGESYPSGNDMSDSRNGVPFLRGSNLKNGKLDNSGANYITLEKHKELTSGHLVYDDIVIAVRGSLGALGYVDIDNVDWNINSQLAIIRTDKSELNGAFVIQFLSSNKGQKELLSRQTGTALKQLPIKQLQDVPVPKPELAEQNKISEFFRQLDDTIALHQHKLEKLKNIKQAYLNEMFV